MIGRRQFGIAGASAIALATLGRSSLGQEKHGAENDGILQSCAKACSDCERACSTCSTHCAHQLQEGNKEHIKTLATCHDCADFCASAARIVARGGPFSALICESCAEACSRCGKECEKFPNDKHMKICAEECRKCEKACREMTKQTGRAS